VCDKPVTSDADTVRCTSRCNGAFHRACLKQSHAAADDKSFECTDCKASTLSIHMLAFMQVLAGCVYKPVKLEACGNPDSRG